MSLNCNDKTLIRREGSKHLLHETKALLSKKREAHPLNYMYIKRDVPALLDTKPIHRRARDGPLFKVAKPNCE